MSRGFWLLAMGAAAGLVPGYLLLPVLDLLQVVAGLAAAFALGRLWERERRRDKARVKMQDGRKSSPRVRIAGVRLSFYPISLEDFPTDSHENGVVVGGVMEFRGAWGENGVGDAEFDSCEFVIDPTVPRGMVRLEPVRGLVPIVPLDGKW